ncbi:MAG: serine--tRNA ligase [Rhodospirillales bacterium]|nr:serine--tRNA ligase [Rhodospirillales bacterium]
MHDIKWIRDHPDAFDAGLNKRGLAPSAGPILEQDTARRANETELQDLQARRNDASKEIGAIKARGGDADALIAEVADLKARVQAGEERGREVSARLDQLLSGLPNTLADDVPEGADESANVEIARVGTPPEFDFEAKQHFEIGEALGYMDFEGAARMSGARFVVLKGPLARLERALADFMLDLHTTEFGYTEVSPPALVRDDAAFGTGQLPKFADDLFKTTNGFWLIPTAEVPLTNLVREQILDEAQLPLRYTAHTLCFRSEAGAAGKDTRGMIRQHQFHKVELVAITHPDQSEAEHERLVGNATAVLDRLELPYRTMMLCAGDTGFSARKTLDIEVWLPGQGAYREISSCSNFGDFQARRMTARFRPQAGKGTRYVHTLNGSGLAVGRTLVAVLENYQQADGSVVVPQVLRPYMGGLEVIS